MNHYSRYKLIWTYRSICNFKAVLGVPYKATQSWRVTKDRVISQHLLKWQHLFKLRIINTYVRFTHIITNYYYYYY